LTNRQRRCAQGGLVGSNIRQGFAVQQQGFAVQRGVAAITGHNWPALRALLLIGALLALLMPLDSSNAFAASRKLQGTVRAQYGDWQVVCKAPPPGAHKETCALVQSVTAEDRNNVGLTVYFQRFSNGTQVLRVFAPVGVLLPPGLGLKIDDQDVGHAPFLRCHTFACYAQVQAPDALVDKLKNGKTAVFIIFQTQDSGIGIPISLNGFAQALAQLH